MMAERDFHIGDVLSVTTGKLLSPRLIEGVYDILGFMTGDSPFTHQLPRFSDECRPVLLRQHPWLADVDVSDITADNFKERLAQIVAEHGETVTVATMDAAEHERIDPLSELAEKVHPDRILTVRA